MRLFHIVNRGREGGRERERDRQTDELKTFGRVERGRERERPDF